MVGYFFSKKKGTGSNIEGYLYLTEKTLILIGKTDFPEFCDPNTIYKYVCPSNYKSFVRSERIMDKKFYPIYNAIYNKKFLIKTATNDVLETFKIGANLIFEYDKNKKYSNIKIYKYRDIFITNSNLAEGAILNIENFTNDKLVLYKDFDNYLKSEKSDKIINEFKENISDKKLLYYIYIILVTIKEEEKNVVIYTNESIKLLLNLFISVISDHDFTIIPYFPTYDNIIDLYNIMINDKEGSLLIENRSLENNFDINNFYYKNERIDLFNGFLKKIKVKDISIYCSYDYNQNPDSSTSMKRLLNVIDKNCVKFKFKNKLDSKKLDSVFYEMKFGYFFELIESAKSNMLINDENAFFYKEIFSEGYDSLYHKKFLNEGFFMSRIAFELHKMDDTYKDSFVGFLDSFVFANKEEALQHGSNYIDMYLEILIAAEYLNNRNKNKIIIYDGFSLFLTKLIIEHVTGSKFIKTSKNYGNNSFGYPFFKSEIDKVFSL